MKKIAIALGLGALAVSCTNAKLVNYNTDRLDNIEAYLKENKFVKPSDNLEKLKNEGQIRHNISHWKERRTHGKKVKSNNINNVVIVSFYSDVSI